ncbi:hypothetical protein N9D63_08850 [Opitutales bacterium]|jgi:hypothetical protein|nr:hypothetical protein [Opitutales bacterium]
MISDWWQSLEGQSAHPHALKIFYVVAIVSGVVLAFQMVLTLIGADTDFDAGEGGDTGLFSIRTIGAFFTGFGWTGVSMLYNGYGLGAATFAATVVGMIFLGTVLYLMRYMFSLREEGTLDYSNAIGEVGNVYLPIPPKRKGMGQVEVLVQGRMRTVRALTDHDKKLGNRTAVRVKALIDQQTLLVESLESESRNISTD